MTMSPSIIDREFQKFVELSGKTVVQVTIIGGSGVSVSFSGLSTAGKITKVELTDAAWTALPGTSLAARNTVLIQNDAGFYVPADASNKILLNYDNMAPADEGIVIEDRGFKERTITADIPIYGRVAPGTASGHAWVIVEELA